MLMLLIYSTTNCSLVSIISIEKKELFSFKKCSPKHYVRILPCYLSWHRTQHQDSSETLKNMKHSPQVCSILKGILVLLCWSDVACMTYIHFNFILPSISFLIFNYAIFKRTLETAANISRFKSWKWNISSGDCEANK